MDWTAIAVGIIPSIGVGLIFWFAMRAVIRADRNERVAIAREEEREGGEEREEREGRAGRETRDDAVPAKGDKAAGDGATEGASKPE